MLLQRSWSGGIPRGKALLSWKFFGGICERETRYPDPITAAADPQNRSLKNYIENVAEPPTNDALVTSRWLESLLRHTTGENPQKERFSALVDLGGGDTALHKMMSDILGLADDLTASGVAPVAVYTLGPRVDDLAALDSFEVLGFQPAATVIVLNEGLADQTEDREDAFARVMRHSVFRKAVDRGATVVWMPVLNPHELVQEIEAKRLGFIHARDAISPPGRKVVPIAPFNRARVRKWLDGITREMAPIMSWLP
jgi:hypothetical protein